MEMIQCLSHGYKKPQDLRVFCAFFPSAPTHHQPNFTLRSTATENFPRLFHKVFRSILFQLHIHFSSLYSDVTQRLSR